MTTRTKLNISINTACIMMLLSVFSKLLHIPDAFEGILTLGTFLLLGFAFYFIKKQKQERREQLIAQGEAARPVTDQRRRTKRALISMMMLCSILGLCSPFLLPLTGTSLGAGGDLICGIIAAALMCAIFGFRLKRL